MIDKDIEAIKKLYEECPAFSISVGRDRRDFSEGVNTRGKAEQWRVETWGMMDGARTWMCETALSLEEATTKILTRVNNDSN